MSKMLAVREARIGGAKTMQCVFELMACSMCVVEVFLLAACWHSTKTLAPVSPHARS